MNPDVAQLAETVAAKLSPSQALLALVFMPVIFLATLYWNRMAARLGLVKPPPEEKTSAVVLARTDALIDRLSAELIRIQALQERYSTELEHIRAARLTLFVRASSFYDAAIAARTMVHEMQRQMSIEETRFEPLPAIPPLEGMGGAD